MSKQWMSAWLAALAIGVTPVLFAGCDTADTREERMEDRLDEAAEEVDDEVHDAAEEIEDEVDDAS